MHTIVNNTKISSYILFYLLKYSLKISLRQSIVGKIGASVRDVTAELDTTATQSCTDQRSQLSFRHGEKHAISNRPRRASKVRG